MDKTKILLPVVIAGLATKVDNSIKITLETRELGSDGGAKLFSLRGQEAWILIAPNEFDEESVTVPKEKADASMGSKTPSQRLRAVLYRTWEQSKSGVDFESYYKATLEKVIDQFKERLE